MIPWIGVSGFGFFRVLGGSIDDPHSIAVGRRLLLLIEIALSAQLLAPSLARVAEGSGALFARETQGGGGAS